MERFEAWIDGGNVVVHLMDSGKLLTTDCEELRQFFSELIGLMREQYPYLIRAVESKIRLSNRSLYTLMQQHPNLYNYYMARQICACCFGERDDVPDYNGERFRMERPQACRDMELCPWCGYRKGSQDKKFVICGARRDYGLTPQERKVVELVRQGVLRPEQMSLLLCITQKSVWNLLSSIYKKTNVSDLPELVYRIDHDSL